MNTINQSIPGPRTTSAGPVEANTPVNLNPTGATAQPYTFVSGSPPAEQVPDASPTYTPGMPVPTVTADQFMAKANTTIAQFDAVDFSQLNTMGEVTNAIASVFALQDLLIQLQIMMRKGNLENRDKELNTMVAEKMTSIAKSLEAAKTEMYAGIISGVGQIAAGAFTAYGGFKGEGINANNAGAVAQGKFSGIGTILNGLAGIGASVVTYQAAKDKNEAAKADLRAEVASARMQQEIERAANARDVFKSVIDSQLQMQQSAVDNVKRTFA